MTATQQPGNPLTRWTKAVIGAARGLHDDLVAAHEAQARLNRFPQPRPQADLAEAKRVHPASAGKVLTGV